ncbi:MAG TPA: maleylpyruvate isomerase family mycothiol-dependent enzyme, partial [Streptosporangiaceae bacterium]
ERSPQAQAADGLAADEKLLTSIESLDPVQRASLRLNLFGMDMDLTGLVGMRLNEHAVHTWDVIVAGDPGATLAADATGLMIDSLGRIVTWAGKPQGTPLAVTVGTTDPDRTFALRADDAVSLQPGQADDGAPELTMPAEALIRLIYGRLDPAHTPPGVLAGDADLDSLRAIFPGL